MRLWLPSFILLYINFLCLLAVGQQVGGSLPVQQIPARYCDRAVCDASKETTQYLNKVSAIEAREQQLQARQLEINQLKQPAKSR